jgi:hypothetical protein
VLPRAQAGEETLKLLNKIRSLAKSATELSSRGVSDAAEYLHVKLWDGAPPAPRLRPSPTRLSARDAAHTRVCGRGAAPRGGGRRFRDATRRQIRRCTLRASADAPRRCASRGAEIRGMSLADIMPLIRAVRPSRSGSAARATFQGPRALFMLR